MSRLFPHADFAEEQPLSKTILATHVLHRGLQSGALLGGIVGAVRSISIHSPARSIPNTQAQNLKASAVAFPGTVASPAAKSRLPVISIRPNVTGRVVAGAGTGSVVGTALLTVGLLGRMNGRENIEWQDRSWRLMESRSQIEVDDWSMAGTAAGVVASRLSTVAASVAPWKRVVGGAGLGNLVGVAGYMVWRYGVNGGGR